MIGRLFALVFLVLGVQNVGAQEEMPWQMVVSGQIEALQAGEAEVALSMAGQGFRDNYDDAARFLEDIRRSGYGPIVDARSHSFGSFRKTMPGTVLQIVMLTGLDQSLYEAVYEMIEEPNLGWRVQGVVLRRVPGIGI